MMVYCMCSAGLEIEAYQARGWLSEAWGCEGFASKDVGVCTSEIRSLSSSKS